MQSQRNILRVVYGPFFCLGVGIAFKISSKEWPADSLPGFLCSLVGFTLIVAGVIGSWRFRSDKRFKSERSQSVPSAKGDPVKVLAGISKENTDAGAFERHERFGFSKLSRMNPRLRIYAVLVFVGAIACFIYLPVQSGDIFDRISYETTGAGIPVHYAVIFKMESSDRISFGRLTLELLGIVLITFIAYIVQTRYKVVLRAVAPLFRRRISSQRNRTSFCLWIGCILLVYFTSHPPQIQRWGRGERARDLYVSYGSYCPDEMCTARTDYGGLLTRVAVAECVMVALYLTWGRNRAGDLPT